MGNKFNFSQNFKYTVTRVEKRLSTLKRLAGTKWDCTQDSQMSLRTLILK